MWSAVAQVPELRQADFPKEREAAGRRVSFAWHRWPQKGPGAIRRRLRWTWLTRGAISFRRMPRARRGTLWARLCGQGKGKGKGPPPPKAKATAKALPEGLQRRQSGMSELLARVEAEGQRKDREEAKAPKALS